MVACHQRVLYGSAPARGFVLEALHATGSCWKRPMQKGRVWKRSMQKGFVWKRATPKRVVCGSAPCRKPFHILAP
jgi:hypothetical protein